MGPARAGSNALTTTATYLSIQNNLARYQKMTAAEPAVKNATKYYTANVSKVTSAKALVSNYRMLSYAMQAYGLGAYVNDTALVTKVLNGGVTNPRALANTLTTGNWNAFAKAYDFVDKGATKPTKASAVAATTAAYTEQQLESDQGQTDPGVQLALYFKRVAPTVTSSYSILGDQNLLEVVQTAFGLAPTSNASQIDAEAKAIDKLVPLKTLQNPTKLNNLTERFTANYDAQYGPAGTGGSLTVKTGNASATNVNASSSILAGIVSSNGTALSSVLGTDPYASAFAATLSALALGG